MSCCCRCAPPRQLVTKWCDSKGVENRGLGPVIFYKGFTREFLKGNVRRQTDRQTAAYASAVQAPVDPQLCVWVGWWLAQVGSSQDLLQDVDRAVKEIGQGKKARSSTTTSPHLG